MQFEMMFSKIHRATVTDANLNYVGSITIDEELMLKAHLKEYQKVDVLNVNNGERFSTYVITGEAGARDICINGAAAHKAKKGDKVIIVAYVSLNEKEIDEHKPYIVHVDKTNNPIENILATL